MTYNYALIITDDCTGYRWLYGLKTKDILKAVKKWYSDIAELREMHTLLAVIRDNAGENKSKEIDDFLESHGIENRVHTSYASLFQCLWAGFKPMRALNLEVGW